MSSGPYTEDPTISPLDDTMARKINEHPHPQDVKVIESSGYEPYVKLLCGVCGSGTFVHR